MTDIVALHPTVISRLKNILSVARDIEHDLGDKPIHTNSPSAAVSITLPPPNDITDDLLKMGLPCASAQRLAGFFMQKCLSLRHSIEEKIKKYISLAQCSPSSELQTKAAGVFEQLYSKLLAKWTSQTLHMAQSRTDNAQRTSQQTRRQFNQDFTPRLENYFEKNPFPSHGDKVVLAGDSSMSYRQIDVWFQNRRSRAKKDGKLFKRPSVHDDGSSSFRDKEKYDPDCVSHQVNAMESNVREHEWRSVPKETVSAASTTKNTPSHIPDVLNPPSPPHAFPSAYPPTCAYDPFPVREGFRTFPSPVWIRQPAKSIPPRPIIDVEVIIADFVKLDLEEGSTPRTLKRKAESLPTTSKKRRMHLPSSSAYCSATTSLGPTRPKPAPLPALIRSSVSTSDSPLPIPLSAPGSRPPAESTCRKRKSSPLPRRSPTHTAHRTMPSSTPHGSPSPSPPPSLSRVPSFGSETSSRSSRSSSFSTPIVTPECSPLPLHKHLVGDPPMGEIQNIDGAYGDCRLQFYSPLDIRSELSAEHAPYAGMCKEAVNPFSAAPTISVGHQ